MRYSILGFNQEELVKQGLDLADTLLLDYVYNACVSPTLKKTHDENDQPHVWLQHKKLLEDLPIIGIGEEALKKRLYKLIDKGMLSSMVKNDEIRGRRTYYTITVNCERLRFSDQVYLNTLSQERPSVSEYTSDNKLNSDNKLKDNSTKVELGKTPTTHRRLITDIPNPVSKPSVKKKSRYEQCVEVIDEMVQAQYTDLKQILADYLKMRLAIKDKPMYVSGWKALIKKLQELSQDVSEQYKIVRQSLENSWATFYPLKTNNYNNGIQNQNVFSEYGQVKAERRSDEVIVNVQF